MISAAWRPRLEFAAKSFIVVAFLGSLAAGVQRLQQKARADEAHRVDLGAWSVVTKPSWCTTDDVRGVRDATRLRGWNASLVDPAAGPVVWRAIESAPQVVRVAGMRKVLPNRFEAVLEVRRPVAAVQLSAGKSPRWVEVDEEGWVLSPVVTERPVREGVPLRQIVGAACGVPRVGDQLGADVREAADLSAELGRYGTDDDRRLLCALDEIDVTNFGGRRKPAESEIVFRMATSAPVAGAKSPTRCDVEWGRARAVDSWDPEPSFGAKATRTVQALRMFPGLAGLKSVRVAFDDLAVVPAAGSPLSPPKK